MLSLYKACSRVGRCCGCVWVCVGVCVGVCVCVYVQVRVGSAKINLQPTTPCLERQPGVPMSAAYLHNYLNLCVYRNNIMGLYSTLRQWR